MAKQEIVLMVRDRLLDGTFGPARKAFEQASETIDEKDALINNLGAQVAMLKLEVMSMKGGGNNGILETSIQSKMGNS